MNELYPRYIFDWETLFHNCNIAMSSEAISFALIYVNVGRCGG